MILTEKEAETKWCPFSQSRVVSFCEMQGEPASVMRVSESNRPTTSCITSNCMAWRKINSEGYSYDFPDEMLLHDFLDKLEKNKEPYAARISTVFMGINEEERREKMDCVGDLRKWPEAEFLRLRGCGYNTFKAIRKVLKKRLPQQPDRNEGYCGLAGRP